MQHRLQRNILLSFLASALLACTGECPDHLGVSDGRLADCPASPNCVSSQEEETTHRIAPLAFSDDPDSAFARLMQMLSRREDTIIVEARPGYLRVEFHTLFFIDDGEFLLDDERRLIQVRSASRLGYSDLGKNRSRLEEIRQQFSELENSS